MNQSNIKIDLENQDDNIENPALPLVDFNSPVEIGKKVELSGLAATINGITTASNLGYFQANTGFVILDIDLTIENVSIPETMGNFSIRLLDEKGINYSSLNNQDKSVPAIEADQLPIGEMTRGHLYFLVPSNISKYLFYKNCLFISP